MAAHVPFHLPLRPLTPVQTHATTRICARARKARCEWSAPQQSVPQISQPPCIGGHVAPDLTRPFRPQIQWHDVIAFPQVLIELL